MSESFIGEIRAFPYSFAPRYWAFCNGQLLPINQYSALFALLGTTYGGNGQTTFGLPDLRGRVALHQGQGPGLQNFAMGQMAGEEQHTLILSEMPQHTHLLSVNRTVPAADNTALAATGNTLGQSAGRTSRGQDFAFNMYAGTLGSATPGDFRQIGTTGGSQPHENRQPFTVLSYCIALQGLFPSRN